MAHCSTQYRSLFCQNLVSFWGLCPLTRGCAPGPHWRPQPQTPIIGSRSALTIYLWPQLHKLDKSLPDYIRACCLLSTTLALLNAANYILVAKPITGNPLSFSANGLKSPTSMSNSTIFPGVKPPDPHLRGRKGGMRGMEGVRVEEGDRERAKRRVYIGEVGVERKRGPGKHPHVRITLTKGCTVELTLVVRPSTLQ